MPRRARYAESRARYYIRDQAAARGWDTRHLSVGGDFLEENEIVASFPDIGLGLDKPDFLLTIAGEPAAVIEAKNEVGKSAQAIAEAVAYADSINATGRYSVNVAIGASGTEEQGFIVSIHYLTASGWAPLTASGFELTNVPSRREVELAILANDATTAVTVPTQAEFIDAAIEVSRILRSARVEAPLRPKVIGALVLAMYESALGSGSDVTPARSTGAGGTLSLADVNELVSRAVEEAVELADARRKDLIEALQLSGAAYQQLGPRIGRIVAILRRLNVRAVMHSDVDFLGTFYEAFLRYGYDNNALGIVFTPRHITRFCVDLVGVSHTDQIVDLACGTGGFLVSAFEQMIVTAPSEAARSAVKNSMFGYDTNPTVWALALLNMYFRGDGKSNIARASSLDESSKAAVAQQFTRAFLNPPFSQDDEPERAFIDASMAALRPDGLVAVVVKAGVFADDDHRAWRAEFTRRHTVLAVISLPDDLFYPTAAATSILIARAHVPQAASGRVYLARISNDGYEKLKGKRVEREGSELDAVLYGFQQVASGTAVHDDRSMTLPASSILDGAEWSPQEWLPQPTTDAAEAQMHEDEMAGSILRTVATFPDLSDQILDDFTEGWRELPELPYGSSALAVDDLFEVVNGKSSGEKNYAEGSIPYISSGDQANSIVSLVSAADDEVFDLGGLTVTAFGRAFVQPWPFVARGNGGSSVRVLVPKYRMSVRELFWFAAQVNVQKWRFFYSRMAIKGRIRRLALEVPTRPLLDQGPTLSAAAGNFIGAFHEQRRALTADGEPLLRVDSPRAQRGN